MPREARSAQPRRLMGSVMLRATAILRFYVLLVRTPPASPLFPYTTLFRSAAGPNVGAYASFDTAAGRVVEAKVGTSFISIEQDRKSTRLNSSHVSISYAVFCLKKKNLQ